MERQRTPSRLGLILAGSVLATGAIVLTGWVLDVPLLKSAGPGLVTMKPNTAVGFLLAGSALFLLGAARGKRAQAAGKTLSLVVGALGVLSLLEYSLGVELGIDEILFREDPRAAYTSHPGRMAPTTAFAFALAGVALWLLPRERWQRATRWVALAIALVAFLALAGYLYGVEPVGLAHYTRMAIHTSAGFLAFSGAVLALSLPPSFGFDGVGADTGAQVVRRLLPASLLLPVLLGWVILKGWRAGHYGAEFALSTFALATAIGFALLVWWAAVRLHRRAERGVRSEERFLATFEQAAVGIAHVAPDGRWLRVNRKLCEIVGYAREELLRLTFQDITHPDDLERDLTQVARMLDGSLTTYAMEKRYFRKDGRVVWIELTVSLVRTAAGEPDYFISVVEEITRRKTAEAMLRATEARLETLSRTNLIGIATASADGGLLDANEAFLGMVGYSLERLRGGLRLPDVVSPGAMGRVLAPSKGGDRAAPFEAELVRRDGSTFPVLMGSGSTGEGGDARIFFVLDISERRRLEEQFRQSQRVETVGRLAGGVAHDFNNLLTPILSYCDLILKDTGPGGEWSEELLEVRRAGERAAALTRQLLAFSRKQVLQPRVVDLGALVSDAANLLRRLIGEDVTLTLALLPRPGWVLVDPGQIEQVLMNLAVNARDAMPRGGQLTVETATAEVDEEYARGRPEMEAGRYVVLSVSDTGTGMSDEAMGHLFEPFFTTKEKGKGTGLGLATVHGIVKQSRGHIWVYSELGRGTTFKVYLPEVGGPATEVEEPAPARAAGGAETVLVVEDDDSLRALVVRVLRSLGYRVLEAPEGTSALILSKTHDGSIDLLLTDVVMPGISGRELAEQIRVSRRRIKILYMSGYTENAIVHHGVLDPATALLEKPFTPDVLAARVRTVLDSPDPP